MPSQAILLFYKCSGIITISPPRFLSFSKCLETFSCIFDENVWKHGFGKKRNRKSGPDFMRFNSGKPSRLWKHLAKPEKMKVWKHEFGNTIFQRKQWKHTPNHKTPEWKQEWNFFGNTLKPHTPRGVKWKHGLEKLKPAKCRS